MGAAVSPVSVVILTAAWLVLVPTALAGVGAVVLAGSALLLLGWVLDGVCALVRGCVGLATGSLMGDVMEPGVHA